MCVGENGGDKESEREVATQIGLNSSVFPLFLAEGTGVHGKLSIS